MNHILEAFARQWLKDHLAGLPQRNRNVFMLMYSHREQGRPINDAIDAMPIDKLDNAMRQVQRTIDHQKKGAHDPCDGGSA